MSRTGTYRRAVTTPVLQSVVRATGAKPVRSPLQANVKHVPCRAAACPIVGYYALILWSVQAARAAGVADREVEHGAVMALVDVPATPRC